MVSVSRLDRPSKQKLTFTSAQPPAVCRKAWGVVTPTYMVINNPLRDACNAPSLADLVNCQTTYRIRETVFDAENVNLLVDTGTRRVTEELGRYGRHGGHGVLTECGCPSNNAPASNTRLEENTQL